jgi:hypothetical protein
MLAYFGEEAPESCDACDNCDSGRAALLGGTALPSGAPAEAAPAPVRRRKRAGVPAEESDAARPAARRRPRKPPAARTAPAPAPPTLGPFPLQARVEHTALGLGIVVGYGSGKINVAFEAHGQKTLSLAVVLERGLLRTLEA